MSTTSTIPTIQLNDGHEIPQLGFGVFQIPPADTATAVTPRVGGRATATSTPPRCTATSKAWRGDPRRRHRPLGGVHHQQAQQRLPPARRCPPRVRETLAALGVEYVDLFLIHWPLPTLYDGDFVSTWRALEEFQRDGRARSIGVSNFQVAHLERLAAETEVTPAVNQIELHPYLPNEVVRSYGESHGIRTEAWSPIAQGAVLDDPAITEIAQRAGPDAGPGRAPLAHPAGDIVFPKSTTPSRIEENFKLFDFELDPADIERSPAWTAARTAAPVPNPDAFAYIPD